MDKYEEMHLLIEGIALLRSGEITLDVLQRIDTLQTCLEQVSLNLYGERRN